MDWNKAEAEFIDEHTRHLVYDWAQLHIAARVKGERFRVEGFEPYREVAIFRKWISSEGYVLATGLKVATSIARR